MNTFFNETTALLNFDPTFPTFSKIAYVWIQNLILEINGTLIYKCRTLNAYLIFLFLALVIWRCRRIFPWKKVNSFKKDRKFFNFFLYEKQSDFSELYLQHLFLLITRAFLSDLKSIWYKFRHGSGLRDFQNFNPFNIHNFQTWCFWGFPTWEKTPEVNNNSLPYARQHKPRLLTKNCLFGPLITT